MARFVSFMHQTEGIDIIINWYIIYGVYVSPLVAGIQKFKINTENAMFRVLNDNQFFYRLHFYLYQLQLDSLYVAYPHRPNLHPNSNH